MGKEEAFFGDASIRKALRSLLLAQHADDSDIRFIEELGLCLGQVRVDIAVVNGLIHGYEIKSDRDSLRRLDRQVDFYGKALDRATLVVGNRHLEKAAALLPTWWGILEVQPNSNGFCFRAVRQARENPSIDPRSLVELLWLDDAIALLERHNAATGVRGKPRRIVWDRICDRIKADEIADAVRNHLKTRSTTLSPRLQS